MKKLLIALIVLGLAAPAMAADFYFYGSFRTDVGHFDTDEDYIGGPAMDGTIGNFGDDDSGTLLSFSGQSRLGAKAIASENFYGVFEMGLRESTRAGDQEELYLRLAYGVWTFGSGKLTVGKDYTPGTFLGYSSMMADIGDQGGANMLVAGLSYIGRQPQIKLSFGTFDIALIQPYTDAADFHAEDIDFDLPRIEAAYVFDTGLVSIRPVAGFQTYDVELATGDEDVTSYLLGVGASFDLEPAYVKTTVSYLQNPGNYGQSNIGMVNLLNTGAITTAPTSIMNAQLVGTEFEDSELLQGTFVVGTRLSEVLGLEAGLSYQKAEIDELDAEQDAMIYYLQAAYTLAPGMTAIPEFGMVDRGDLEIDGLGDFDSGKMWYANVTFRADF